MKKKHIYKKLIVCTTALLLIAGLLSSCNNDPSDYSSPDGMLTATNEAVNYYFFYPSTWKLDKNEGMISVLAGYDGSTGKSDASVSVTDFKYSDAEVSDGFSYWEAIRDEYKATFADMEIIEEKSFTIATETFPYITYTATVGAEEYKFTQIFIYSNAQIYIITYSAKESVYDTYSAEFEELAASFRGK